MATVDITLKRLNLVPFETATTLPKKSNSYVAKEWGHFNISQVDFQSCSVPPLRFSNLQDVSYWLIANFYFGMPAFDCSNFGATTF